MPGFVIEAISTLSKPTTPTSSGTLSPYLFAAFMTEMANTSAAQNMASGLSLAPSNWDAAEYPRL